MILLLAAVAEAQSSKPTTVRLSAGSTASVSGAYVWSVAVTRVVNKYAGGINVTLVESGGGYDNIKKIREGFFDLTTADGWGHDLEMYKGIETFKGNPWEPIRWFFLRDLSVGRNYVRADSGIATWSDMAGKKISGGTAGSAGAVRPLRCDELLGTGVKVIWETLADAVRDVQSGRIHAVNKSSPADTFDAALMEVHLLTPLTVIGFSEEEAAKINAKYPHFLIAKTPAGSIKPLPKLGSIWEIYILGGATTSSRLPEEVGYRIIKALCEHWSEIVQAYPSCAPYHPIKDYIKMVPKGMEVPLHAGVVRYAKEIGIDLPAGLIPPEYRGK